MEHTERQFKAFIRAALETLRKFTGRAQYEAEKFFDDLQKTPEDQYACIITVKQRC